MNHFYFANDEGIYVVELTNGNVRTVKLADLDLQSICAFDADPVSGNLYLSDALNFDQQSQIYRFDTTGIMLDQFRGGINTTGFYFCP